MLVCRPARRTGLVLFSLVVIDALDHVHLAIVLEVILAFGRAEIERSTRGPRDKAGVIIKESLANGILVLHCLFNSGDFFDLKGR